MLVTSTSTTRTAIVSAPESAWPSLTTSSNVYTSTRSNVTMGVGLVASSRSAEAPPVCRHRYVSEPPSCAKLSRPSSMKGSELSRSTWTVSGVPSGWARATGSDSLGGGGGGMQAPGITVPTTVSNNPSAQRIEIMASLQLDFSSGVSARCVQLRKGSIKRSTPSTQDAGRVNRPPLPDASPRRGPLPNVIPTSENHYRQGNALPLGRG